MRPNGRTLYKVLMKGRGIVFWGRRAFLTVRIPACVLPVPRPPIDYCKGWGVEIMDGMWEKHRGDGAVEHRSISRLSSGDDPRTFANKEPAIIHHLTSEIVGGWTIYRWWEGTLRIVHNEGTDEEVVERSNLPAEDITAHQTVCEWRERYMDGTREAVRGIVLDAFLNATQRAKTHYAHLSEDGRFITFTYSVKWFYHGRTRRFCSDLARAFRIATNNGIDVKLMRNHR